MSREGLPGPDAAFHLLEEVVDRSPADQTEGVLVARRAGLTRFAGSRIHQNVVEEDAHLLLRVVVDGRVAGLRTNRLVHTEMNQVLARAVAIARQIPPDPDFPGLPAPPGGPLVYEGSVPATAEATPHRRAEAVRHFVQACGESPAAGALETGVFALAVVNSRGVRAYGRRSRASLVAVVQEGEGSGYVQAIDADLDRLDLTSLGALAAARARAARHPVDLEPGTYPVILEPPAVGLMLAFLAMTTFNGKAVLEGRSALATRLGQRVMDPRVQIWDDATDPRTIGLPFDFEGLPKRRLDLVREGVAVGVAYDSRTAHRAGVPNTAHALPQPNPFGPMPTHMLMAPGRRSLEELVAATERGLLVTRFHYVRVVHPARTLITGMTRDGTFLVEGGRIVRALRNLRFNVSILEVFAAVEEIGANGRLVGEELAVFAPPVAVRRFTFTGLTPF
ncbi:MAG: metallopeptidase TldD-related protein [Armatimonadota bacterium]|nr:metallopeptidase TldD-related protein [Armatimonadota bacterium]MDR7426404.1 metallopeptidase TldD-related protein [Armatimonadota bacterium]MDR7465414.1 metallopeptidase TldD-related protein [Armatimonadota bacterium]MDR7469535.1 metallopeptidase TldD-related protein [Armatimonadota bacterium]MDR7473457.1 metallopeptidase TldD-related protein [Armatimonadota bacterium]